MKTSVLPKTGSDSGVGRPHIVKRLVAAIIMGSLALVASAQESAAPSIGLFAINEKGLSKLQESGTAEAFENGNARIRIRFFRFGGRGDWIQLDGFLVNMPSIPADKLQVWQTTCDVYIDRDCVGEQRPIETKITRTSQDGVYLVKILAADGRPSKLKNQDTTRPLYLFIGAPVLYAPPQPVFGVLLLKP